MHQKNSNNKKTAVVAMSGGVDSSVAASLLLNQGYNLIGITMKTWGYDDFPSKDSGCCSLEAINDARNVAVSLGFPHYTFDFTDRFNDIVVNNFIDEYLHGRTPNPCVLCNKAIKWGSLLEKANSLGADFIATGHYANINFDSASKRYFISKAEDLNKDQSYALWQLSQYALSKTLLPLGKFTKTKIRDIASTLNLKSADTPDSQEICFVPDDDYRKLLQIRVPDLDTKHSNGKIIYKNKVIGKHKGFTHYTIGQRRGLNVSIGKPVYVSEIDHENNIIYVDDEKCLYHSAFIVKDINLMLYEKLTHPLKANVKIRYKDEGASAEIEQLNTDELKITFHSPRKAITPGQSAVFYQEDNIIGGGIIDRIIL